MRTLALVLLCLGLTLLGPWLRAEPAPVEALECESVVSIVRSNGTEFVTCIDAAELAGCKALRVGERYGGCEALGPMRGPVLALRGLPIDVNRGSEEDFRTIRGVGAGVARRLVEGREGGPYCEPLDLLRVSGIGEKRVLELQKHFRFEHEDCRAR